MSSLNITDNLEVKGGTITLGSWTITVDSSGYLVISSS